MSFLIQLLLQLVLYKKLILKKQGHSKFKDIGINEKDSFSMKYKNILFCIGNEYLNISKRTD